MTDTCPKCGCLLGTNAHRYACPTVAALRAEVERLKDDKFALRSEIDTLRAEVGRVAAEWAITGREWEQERDALHAEVERLRSGEWKEQQDG